MSPLLLALTLDLASGQFAADLPKDPLAAMGPACVVDHPAWTAQPNGDDMTRYYPLAVPKDWPGSRVELGCKVRADGSLGGCHVRSEAPKGGRFAAATLRLVQYFRLDMAQSRDTRGGPPAGCEVRVKVRWAHG